MFNSIAVDYHQSCIEGIYNVCINYNYAMLSPELSLNHMHH